MFSEGDIGVLPPLGVYDPLGLIETRNMARYEVMEIKHGRAAMLGFLHVILIEAGARFPTAECAAAPRGCATMTPRPRPSSSTPSARTAARPCWASPAACSTSSSASTRSTPRAASAARPPPRSSKRQIKSAVHVRGTWRVGRLVTGEHKVLESRGRVVQK